MIATKAIHKLGDLSREEDICIITDEDDDNYIGMWVTGYGFGNVKFAKSSTRELTPEEIEKYNSMYVQINNQPAVKLKVVKVTG